MADGIENPAIVTTAADPTVGPARGIDDLLLALRALGQAKQVIHQKLVTELEVAAERLAAAAGVEGAGGTGFSGDWEVLVADVAGFITDDVIGGEVRQRARRKGASSYRSASALLRRRSSPVSVELQPRVTSGPGAMRAIRSLDSFVGDLARKVEGETSTEVRTVGGEIDGAVIAAVDTISYGETITIPSPPPWTAAISWMRRLLTAVVVVGALLVSDAVRTGNQITVPAAITLGALALVLLSASIVARIGSRTGAAVVDDTREAIVAAARRELDRRVGKPLRDALRKRAGVAAAFAEFHLLMYQVDDLR
jgi:hypothetical protein